MHFLVLWAHWEFLWESPKETSLEFSKVQSKYVDVVFGLAGNLPAKPNTTFHFLQLLSIPLRRSWDFLR